MHILQVEPNVGSLGVSSNIVRFSWSNTFIRIATMVFVLGTITMLGSAIIQQLGAPPLPIATFRFATLGILCYLAYRTLAASESIES